MGQTTTVVVALLVPAAPAGAAPSGSASVSHALAAPHAYAGGGVIAFGAPAVGDPLTAPLNSVVVAQAANPAATSSDDSYWLASADGGVYAEGNAGYYGSLGALQLQGPIVAMVPTGNGHELQAAATLDAIRRTLLEARVTSGLRIGSYPAEPGLTAPIQLSFPSIEAQVHDCGDWTEDVRATTYSNTSYPNFGCGTQKTLAAQIDDPRDLVRPRAEAASDVVSRSNAVNALRANSGKDIGAIGGTGSTTTTSSGN